MLAPPGPRSQHVPSLWKERGYEDTEARSEYPSGNSIDRTDSGGCQRKANLLQPEAIKVLTYPRQERRLENVASLLPRGIQSVLLQAHGGEAPPSGFTSGRRRYVRRVFSLNSSAGTGTRSGIITALLLERDSGSPGLHKSVVLFSGSFRRTCRHWYRSSLWTQHSGCRLSA